jgi:hypothetical protein
MVIAGKSIQYLQSDRLGILAVTGVVGGLAATGLAARDLDRAARIFEQFHSRKAYRRSKQINKTRDKQRYTHSARPAFAHSKDAEN